MKLYLKNSSGHYQKLVPKNQTIYLSTFFNYIQLTLNEEVLYEVIINDMVYSCEKNDEGDYIIPCYMSRENHTAIQLMIDKKPIRIAIKYAEELYVGDSIIDSFADFHRSIEKWLQGEKKSIHQLVEAIKGGEIHLLKIINPLTGLDDESFLEEIEKALPLALDICTRPRQHLRMEEEVMDVELVKRVTPSSLQHLASHSEHWRSRTITGLVPSRLRAEIYEDDINIYENIFFKMVVQAIYLYMAKKHEQVNMAISQKDTLHDWEYYASEINDYHKLKMLHSLLPEYDSDAEDGSRRQLQELMERILKIERQLSSVISTPFFQRLDATKRLELPIQPTNIINMDNRYHELFKLWNKLLTLNNKVQENLSGAILINSDDYYQSYVQVLSIYSLHLLGYEFRKDSFVEMTSEHSLRTSISFQNEYCVVQAKNQRNGLEDIVTFTIEESLAYEVQVPKAFPVSFRDYEDDLVFQQIQRDEQQVLVFRKKPDHALVRKLSDVVKKYIDNQKSPTDKQKQKLKKMDTDWRKAFSEEMARIPTNRMFELNIHSLFRLFGSTESQLQKYTDNILNSVQPSKESSTIYMLPIQMEDFSKVENPDLLQRLTNLGEAFSEKDAREFGNYRGGILALNQTDLRSIQRLSKLFNVFIYRQLIRWGKVLGECPACKSKNISQIDEHSWQCREAICQLVWGVTKCSTGCHEYYEWMRPNLKPKLTNPSKPNEQGHQLNKILLHEMLFDRSVLTAFDYRTGNQNEFIYYPRCPKCGKSSIH